MALDSPFHDAIDPHLTSNEMASFESGDLCLFLREPKYAFVRMVDGDYQIADVVLDTSPDTDTDMRIYHEVHDTRLSEVLERLEDQSEIDAYPVEVGFGDLV